MTKILILAIVLGGPAILQAGRFSSLVKGTTSGQFLKLGAGARAAAMGEAFSAVAEDATAVYWNPAALSRIENKTVSFMHSVYMDSLAYEYLAYGHNLDAWGHFGVGFSHLSIGEIAQTDVSRARTGTFSPSDTALSFSYAHSVNGFVAGGTAKYIRSKIVNSASTFAFDAGALSPSLQLMEREITMAFVIQNLGGELKYDKEGSRLPFNLKMGVSSRLWPVFIASLDINFPIDNDPYLSAGAEHRFGSGNVRNFFLRGGINSKTIGDIGGFSGVSFGFGADFGGLTIDYAFVPMGNLGMTHRISLSFDGTMR